MSAINYAILAGPEGGADNMGGLTSRAFLASIKDFLVIQKPISNPTTFSHLVDISTAHTFNVGKCFKKIYCTMDKGKFDAKTQGDTDGKSFKLEGEIFYPGSESEAHGFAAQSKNDNFIVLEEMPDSEDSGYIQIGTEQFPCKISPEFTVGTNASGTRGYIFKFEAMARRVYIYKGAISLTPAV